MLHSDIITMLINNKENVVISGGQGAGKTTYLKQMLRELPKTIPLCVFAYNKAEFANILKTEYPERSVTMLEKSDDISTQQDGVLAWDEIAKPVDYEMVSEAIGSGTQTFTTSHVKTSKELLHNFKEYAKNPIGSVVHIHVTRADSGEPTIKTLERIDFAADSEEEAISAIVPQ